MEHETMYNKKIQQNKVHKSKPALAPPFRDGQCLYFHVFMKCYELSVFNKPQFVNCFRI